MSDEVSVELFRQACEVMPGGVNSPVRAWKSVGNSPVFIKSAHGSTLVGADGTEYVDYVGSWGPMILGHAHPEVLEAVISAAKKGTSYGAPTEGETDIARVFIDALPSVDMVRCVSSGTEAVMGAIRVARGFTGRDIVVKCEGGYHGGADYLLVKAGSGLATLGEPDSAGVPAPLAATTATLQYNDIEGLSALFEARGEHIAAVIIEPVSGNMGCVPPTAAWLEALRETTKAHGALLIFDEVMTGFRVAWGGAQNRFGVTPDLTCLGKVVGGGMPLGAYGGRREIMERIAPLGPVYQAGTLSGNPVAVQAGLATLRLLQAPGAYDRLEAISAEVEQVFRAAAAEHDITCRIQRVGAMLTVFFNDGSEVSDWSGANACDRERFARFHKGLTEGGVYWPCSQFEAAFPSLAHDAAAIDKTREAAKRAFAALS